MAKTGYQPGFIFGAPGREHVASKRPARGRVCSSYGCETILSTYNTSDSCWLHVEPPRKPPLSNA